MNSLYRRIRTHLTAYRGSGLESLRLIIWVVCLLFGLMIGYAFGKTIFGI
jgi:hypothetical protein